MVDDFEFVECMLELVNDAGEQLKVSPTKEDLKEKGEEPTIEALSSKDLKRCVKIHEEGRFYSDSAEKVKAAYEEQVQKFTAVKAEIDQKKFEGSEFTYGDLYNYHYMILSLFVDFGRKEVAVLQDLWHFKVQKLLKDIK